MDRRTRMDKGATKTDVTFGNEYKVTVKESEIKLLTYILDSLCIGELTNKGRHFLYNELYKRGGNYSK